MLSYQHGYHAGNFADVIKHNILVRLLVYLTQKDKPLFYLDTHSGKGLYNLQDRQAQKTAEYQKGIQLLWDSKAALSPVFNPYITILDSLNHQEITSYPGSPYIAMQLLRQQDRAYFCELHPGEFKALEKLPHFNKRVHTACIDGIHAMKALLPPPEKRALIFLDPSYELKEEYKTIPKALKDTVSKFTTGVYCLWYPIIDRWTTDQLLNRLKLISDKATLKIEFNYGDNIAQGMTGCGLWLLNPPYTLISEAESLCQSLKNCFAVKNASYLIETL